MERALPVASPSLRAARSGAVAVASVGASLAGHVLAGAGAPPFAGVVAFTAAVAALTTVLSRLRWTPARLFGALAVAQGGFHLAFGHLASSGSGAGAPAGAAAMVLWHLVATAVTCAVVLRAERWLWQALRGLRRLPVPAAVFAAALAPPAARTARPRLHGWRGGHGLRSPPRPALT